MRHCPTSRLLLLLLGLLALSLAPFAQQKPTYPAYSAHVNDFANVVDANTKAQIETILTNFEKVTGAQIAVVTMTTIGERPLEEYANGLYRAWGIGAKAGPNKDKGALLLVLTQDRRSRLEVGYVLEGDMPDGLAGEQLRRMRPYFQQQQWSQGLMIGTRTLVDTLAEKWNVNVAGIDRQFAYQPAAAPDIQLSTRTMLLLGLGFLVLLFLMSRLTKGAASANQGRQRDSSWWAAPMIFHQGGGGFGGGSWGGGGGGSGGGGGGSWGGFGGGSGGGGGASDSW